MLAIIWPSLVTLLLPFHPDRLCQTKKSRRVWQPCSPPPSPSPLCPSHPQTGEGPCVVFAAVVAPERRRQPSRLGARVALRRRPGRQRRPGHERRAVDDGAPARWRGGGVRRPASGPPEVPERGGGAGGVAQQGDAPTVATEELWDGRMGGGGRGRGEGGPSRDVEHQLHIFARFAHFLCILRIFASLSAT